MRPHATRVLPLLAVSFLLLALLSGCVSQSKYEELEAELAACEQSKAEAEAEVISWEQRFDRESRRWEQVGESVQDALPRALSELDQERDRILELVPAQVQSEVSTYLDDYFNTVMAGFDRLQGQNEEMRIELKATQKALEALGADTRDIGQAINTSLESSRSTRERIASDLVDMIDYIVAFDQTHLNCKRCDERLRMRDSSRQELLVFHAELVADLAELQTFTSLSSTTVAPDASPDADYEEMPAAEAEADAEAGTGR